MNKYNNFEPDKLNYIIYCRKSSESEDRQVQSLETQMRELTEYVKKNNLNVVKIITESKSAFTIGREGFEEMVNLINTKKANGVLVIRANRISRNPIDAGQIISLLDNKKLLFVRTPNSGCYTGASNDKMMLALELILAKKDSDGLGEMVKEGQMTKALNGTPHGIATIGFLNSKHGEKGERNWFEDKERLPKIKKLLELFLTRNYSAGKLHQVAVKEIKLTTPQRKRLGGKLINLSRIYRILADPIYAGFFYHNGVRCELDKNLPRLITEEQHEEIKRILSKRHIPKVQKHKMTYSGYITSPEGDFIGQCLKFQMICDCKHKFAHRSKTNCPSCGIEIDKTSNPKFLENKYYYNVTKKKTKVEYKSLDEKTLESKMIKFVDENLNFSPALLEWSKKYIHEIKDKEVSENLFLREDKIKRQTEFEKKKMRSREMLRDNQITNEEYKSDLVKLENDYADLKIENKSVDWLEKLNDIVEIVSEAKNVFAGGDMNSKRNLLSKLSSHLTWDDKELFISNGKNINTFVNGVKEAKLKVKEFAPSIFPLNDKGFTMKKPQQNEVLSCVRNRRDSNPRSR